MRKSRSWDTLGASSLKAQMQALRVQKEEALLGESRPKQLLFLRAMDDSHARELEDFEATWARQAAARAEHAALLRHGLEGKHRADYGKQMERLMVETEPRAPRWSRDLLQLRKQQERMAEQTRHDEAAAVKAAADVVEAKEREAWLAARAAKIAVGVSRMLEKQHTEKAGLESRIEASRQEHEQQKIAERRRLVKRCQSVKAQACAKYNILGHAESGALARSPRGPAQGLWEAVAGA